MRTALSASVVFCVVFSAGCRTCAFDWVLLPEKRAFNALKNRTTVPGAADFEAAATLEALLAPGDDRTRWSHTRAAAIEGIVVRVHDAGRESANCFSGQRVDTHIELAVTADASPAERLIAEVTPPIREWAARRALDWSTAALQQALVGRRVRIEGWLLFDAEHDQESENTRPGRRNNWRRTAWEIHPITSIALLR